METCGNGIGGARLGRLTYTLEIIAGRVSAVNVSAVHLYRITWTARTGEACSVPACSVLCDKFNTVLKPRFFGATDEKSVTAIPARGVD